MLSTDVLLQTRLAWFGHVEGMDIQKSAIVGSLQLMAKMGEVDHVKHGPVYHRQF